MDGAIEPILVRGQSVVLEGFGFGAAPGAVRFARAGGGVVEAPAASWGDFTIVIVVPDSAVSGPVTVVTAGDRRLGLSVHVVPRVPFDPAAFSWQARTSFPRSPAGLALSAVEFPLPGAGGFRVTVFAAGGAEPLGGDSAMALDSAVHVARAGPDGTIGAWERQRAVLPAGRAFAAAVVATRYNSRFEGGALYVIGGVDSAGRAQASVFGADVGPDSVLRRFSALEPLPAPVAGAIAVVRRGRIYVIGGADSLGRPTRAVYVGRVGRDGRIDGWYRQPDLTAPRAYGGAVVLDGRVVAFGGVADSVGPGGGLDATPARLVTADTAAVSLVSGFFTGSWGAWAPPLPEGRSQFATLDLGTTVLVVGGMYPGAAAGAAETIAAAVVGPDSLGPFAGPVGVNTIAGLGGGTLVGSAAATWRDADGRHRGLIAGGMDLQTRQRRAGVWGF